MKKQEKIDLIQMGIQNKIICNCLFSYDSNSLYYYPLDVNDKLFLGQEVDDFQLDGYCIHKIAHIKDLKVKEDKYCEINKLLGVEDNVVNPQIDINSLQSAFNDLMRLNVYIEIECGFDGQFLIGTIESVAKNKLYFKSFDADGVWDEAPFEIPFAGITCVRWGDRYSTYWKRYMDSYSSK